MSQLSQFVSQSVGDIVYDIVRIGKNMLHELSEISFTSGVVRVIQTRTQKFNDDQATSWSIRYPDTKLKALQNQDANIGPLLKWFDKGRRPATHEITSTGMSPAIHHYWNL